MAAPEKKSLPLQHERTCVVKFITVVTVTS